MGLDMLRLSGVSLLDSYAEYFVGHAWKQRSLPEVDVWEELPLSSIWAPIVGTVLYLSFLYFGKRFMANRPGIDVTAPFAVKSVLFVHNTILTLVSLAMFVGLLYQLVDFVQLQGAWHAYCDPDWRLPNHGLPFWCYVFYLSKYYELLDTVFLVLKKRPVRFVQSWHHTTVLWLFWSYNKARMMNHWVLVLLNTFVHVFVYGYFTAATLRISVPWKNYITLLQLSQFAVDILYALPFAPVKYLDATPGDWGPWVIGQFIGFTFLYLFADVYFQNRRKAAAAKKAA